jgi:uncharacterized BrkB/YihY/UPF0761 family membrane protein
MAKDRATDPSEAKVGRVKTAIVGVKTKSQDVLQRAEAARPRSATIDTTFRAIDIDRNVGGGVLAGALAFRLFLWLLPLALLMVGVLGAVIQFNQNAPDELADTVGLSSYITSSISAAGRSGTAFILTVGIFGLYLTSSAAFRTLRLIHLFAWQMPITPVKQVWRGALGFTLLTTSLMVLSALTNGLRKALPGPGLVVTLAMMFVIGFVWYQSSRRLPHPKDLPWTALVPGAILVAVGLQAIHLVTVFYLAPKLSHSSQVYGPLGAAATLLLWVYIISRLVVASAVLNAALSLRTAATLEEQIMTEESEARAD